MELSGRQLDRHADNETEDRQWDNTDDENHPDNETMIQQTDNKTADIKWDHRLQWDIKQTMRYYWDKYTADRQR